MNEVLLEMMLHCYWRWYYIFKQVVLLLYNKLQMATVGICHLRATAEFTHDSRKVAKSCVVIQVSVWKLQIVLYRKW